MSALREATTPVDAKLLDTFHAVAVDKRLVNEEGVAALPSFVNEWLIRRFFRDDNRDESRVRMRLFVEQYLPGQGKKEEIKARLRNFGSYKLIDEFSVRVDLRRNRFLLTVPSLDIRDGRIWEEIVDRHPMLLSGGVWGAGHLRYEEDPDGEMFVRLDEFEPIQISSFDRSLFIEKRAAFTVDEWIDTLIASQGLNPWAYQSVDEKLLLVTRLLPMVQANLNMVELAPKGTGKTFVYKNLSYYSHVISGGTISASQLFYNLGPSKAAGLLVTNDVVVFDEIQTISFERAGVITGILKDYLESGSFSRGGKKASARASIVMQGNIPLSASRRPRSTIWFHELPKALQETALISRLHVFLPGWLLPKINVSEVALSSGYGLAADYLSEALHSMRDHFECDRYVARRVRVVGTEDIRDERAVQRTTAALVRLLFPHLDLSDDEFRTYCVEPAIRYRQLIRDQLHLMDEEFPAYSLDYQLRPDLASTQADSRDGGGPS